MKKIILLGFLVLFIPAMVSGQDRVNAPIWNVGDRWNLTEDLVVSVSNADENTYGVKYLSAGGQSILVVIVYDKSSLNRLYVMDKDKRIKYQGRNKRLFNFPLEIGKSWTDTFTMKSGTFGAQEFTVVETITPLGWEDIQIQAGKFRAVKLEYKSETVEQAAGRPKEGKAWYWYSPDVKYMLKCQYDRTDYWDGIYDWELTSIKLTK
jgi:hypothetical protein